MDTLFSFDVFFDLRLNNGWVNYREAGDLRRHRVHYDVMVMWQPGDPIFNLEAVIRMKW